MQIQAIKNVYGSYNKNSRVSKQTATKSVQNNNLSFNGNYFDTYCKAVSKQVRNRSECLDLLNMLVNGVKTEKLSENMTSNIRSILNSSGADFLRLSQKITNGYSNVVVAKSPSYGPDLIRAEGDSIIFNHPISGEYGRGKISFTLESNGDLTLVRPKGGNARTNNYNMTQTIKFWKSTGKMKEYYDCIIADSSSGGGIINQVYYKEDGTQDFWKNLFLA